MVDNAPKNWGIPPASELSSNDWDTMLPIAYDSHGNGCNNEIARIFGSTEDETRVNTLSSLQTTNILDNPSYFQQEFEKIAYRMSRCVIIMIDRCEESNAVLKHYLPWMANDKNFCNKANADNAAKSDKSRKILRENASEAIISQNYMDELVFQFGEKLFERQFQVATSNSSSDD